MIRFFMIGSATLLCTALASVWPGSARLMGPDESALVRGGQASNCVYPSYGFQCPNGNGANCNATNCVPQGIMLVCPTPPAGNNWVQQVSPTYSECTLSNNGAYSICNQNNLICTIQYTCMGCTTVGMQSVCNNGNPTPLITKSQVVTVGGNCTSS